MSSNWQEYERLKAEVANRGLTDREYQEAIQRIAEELGL